MSKNASKNLRNMAPNSRADERYRHKQWTKKRTSDCRKLVRAQAENECWLKKVMSMMEYGF